jgi:predicted Ser/Thr protein kinase
VVATQFGTIALERGFVTGRQLDDCLTAQRTAGEGVMLGQVMLRRGLLTTDQFLDVLRVQEESRRICGKCGRSIVVDASIGACPACAGPLVRATPVPSERAVVEGDVPARLGPYELIELVGRGGMGMVYRAKDVRLGREVAVKVLRDADFADPSVVTRFVAEARNAAGLSHPNIAVVHDAGDVPGFHFFAMEFVRGRSLDALIRDGRLSRDAHVAILEKVARAIHHAHERGVIHRDVKPANVIVDAAGDPKVVDFGLSKARGAERALSRSGSAMGSPFYMAPEQVRGDHAATTERTDVYALGIMLYEALVRRMPFDAPTVLDIYCKIITAEPPRPRSIDRTVPPELEAVCLKAIEKDASKRYASAEDFAEELRRFRQGEPVVARPISSMRMTIRRVRRHRSAAGWIALGAAAAALVASAIAWFRPGAAPPPSDRAERLELAVRDLTRTIDARPDDVYARLFRAWAHSELGRQREAAGQDPALDYEAAVRDAEIAVPPGSTWVYGLVEKGSRWTELAEFRHRRGLPCVEAHRAALACFSAAIDADDGNSYAYNARAANRLHLAKCGGAGDALDAAAADAREAMRLGGNDDWARRLLAEVDAERATARGQR